MKHEYNYTVDDGDIRITPEASEQIKMLFEQAPSDAIRAIRLYVSGGGCGGLTYGMHFAKIKTEYDKVLEVDDYMVYIDVVALSFLRGVEIDFSVYGSFVFNNVFQDTGGSGMCGGCGGAGEYSY
jgi:iron-sulfur cluster insertion protein